MIRFALGVAVGVAIAAAVDAVLFRLDPGGEWFWR